MDEEFDYWTHQDTLMDELKAAAFEYLLTNPGCEFVDWQQGLIDDYPEEVVDALGNNPGDVYAALADLWEDDYEDPRTGTWRKFGEWAMVFANEYAVQLYYDLADACAELKKAGRKLPW